MAAAALKDTSKNVEENGVQVTVTCRGLMTAEGPDGPFDVNGYVSFSCVAVNTNTYAAPWGAGRIFGF